MIPHTTHVKHAAILRFLAILGMVFGMFAPLAQAAPAYALSASQYSAWGWGSNAAGQLGDGTTTNRFTPVQASGPTGVTAIAAGNTHTIALESDGTVWAWGQNVYGQLGDGSTTNRSTPVLVSQLSGLTTVAAVAAGGNHSLALKSDGTVWAWGFNGLGQLGNGTTDSRSTPVLVSGLSGVTAIAAGRNHSLALKSDGTVWAWGDNAAGQLGDGTTVNRSTPVSGLTGATAIAARFDHSLALKSDSTMRAWGYNGFGQLGDGTTANRSTPVQVSGLTGVTTISAGFYHSLAVKNDSTIWVWGYNQYGQLGDGTQTSHTAPVRVSGITGASAIAGGDYHTVALMSDGTVWTWGFNRYGQLGADPTGTNMVRLSPGQVNGLSDVMAISANQEQSFAIRNIDTIAPTIAGSRAPAANGFGWNNSPVVAHFDCSDAESGIAGCESDYTFVNEGAGQSYTGMAIDNAGNTATATVKDVNIDRTAPTLTGTPMQPDNAAGWFNADVTIHWSGQDALSGIDPATQPADSLISGEGRNLSAGPVIIFDKAGNEGVGFVDGIKIDRNGPTISGATVNDDGTPRAANAAGWFNSTVRVRFTCADPALADGSEGSGVANCSDDKVLATDGANQSVTSDSASDYAGNTTAGKQVAGINVDSQAPQSAAVLMCNIKNGYCRGAKATILLSATDQAGLSGVEEIHYSTDHSATWQTIAGASGSFDITLNRSGKASFLYKAIDDAGNEEAANTIEVKYDTIAPTVTHALTPAANAAGWNNANVAVDFSAEDDQDGSGVDASTWVNQHITVSAETAGQTIAASVEDLAGNRGTDSATVKLDKTAPTLSGAATMSANGNGWYNSAVAIHWTCNDVGPVQSGIATCSADDTITTDGAGQSRSGTTMDQAGNSASYSVSGINIDSVVPTITLDGIMNGGIYTLGAVPTATCAAVDTLSGLDSTCSVSVTGGSANGVGTFSFTATAKDKAGNTAAVTGSYRVIYRFDGFLQPINDTSHSLVCGAGCVTSIFKGGSTVPAKFQLKKADGTIIQASSLPQWLTPAKGNPTTVPIDEVCTATRQRAAARIAGTARPSSTSTTGARRGLPSATITVSASSSTTVRRTRWILA
jgi:alpha-tubulin suppressor-like RCC1 family protein